MSDFLASSSLPSLGESCAMMAATLGGVGVFAGLLWEKITELKTESHKIHHLGGWSVLMIGIILEIAVAGWIYYCAPAA